MVILGAAGIGTYIYGADFVFWRYILENQIQIITANLIIAFVLSWFVYLNSFSVKPHNKEHRELAHGGSSGNIMYDWFKGRELNPRVNLPIFGEIDLKVWCELRPGLLAWLLYDLAYIVKQYKTHGHISDSILVTTALQALYIFDGIYLESALLTTMDVTTDGFGFMLAFGDLAWLPFIYSLQARYLSVHPVHLGWLGIAGALAPQALGYYIFRSANNEKDKFRQNPKDPQIAHLTYMDTARGTRLLTSGWWGWSRHPNYIGDWLMAWSYCLPTGIAGYQLRHPTPHTAVLFDGDAKPWGMLVTYFYVIYFGILLVHRASRDDMDCAKKYGKDWDEYKRRVPWKIVKYIY